MAKHKNMKLFVWSDVFCDYTCGIAFALAETKEEAITIIVATEPNYLEKSTRKELEGQEPEVIDLKRARPKGWRVWGGG